MLIFGLRCRKKLTHGDPGACRPQLKDRARPAASVKFMVNPFVLPWKPSGQACGRNGLGITTQIEGGTRWGRNPADLTPACQRGVRKEWERGRGRWIISEGEHHRLSASPSAVQHPAPGDGRRSSELLSLSFIKQENLQERTFPSSVSRAGRSLLSSLSPSLSFPLSLYLSLSPLFVSHPLSLASWSRKSGSPDPNRRRGCSCFQCG